MDQMKRVYWKLSDYINEIKDMKELDSLIKDLARYNEKDVFQRIKNEIKIEDDWIIFAESKMKYVEKAVFENRQFIREEGEVLPIERIKRVSHNSVEHLAKHSDYIEKYTKDEEIIPSKLYTVNKDTDYGVYENKFIYLLLLTLSDFITRVKDDILASIKSDNGIFNVSRKNEILGDEITLSLRMTFKSLDVEDSILENEASKLKRMDELKERVNVLLQTPLMQIVSREPVISSNITKTNVLTMNENFQNSLELYEYLLNYDKSFYKNEKIANVVPLSSNLAFPVIGFELLVSLLKSSLMDEYEASSKALEVDFKKKAIDDLSKRIEKLKDSYQNDPASYIALLEDKIKLLEGERENSIALKDSLDKIILANDDLKKENESLTKDIENLLSKLKDVEDKLKDIHLAEDLVRREYEDKLKEKNAEIVELRDSLKKKSDECVSITIEKQNALAKIDKLKEDLDSLRKNNSEAVREFELKLEEKDREIQELLEFKRLNEARFKGIQAMAGELKAIDAEVSKEAFDELENEYNAFTRYYEEVWNRTKKEIIKEIKRKKG